MKELKITLIILFLSNSLWSQTQIIPFTPVKWKFSENAKYKFELYDDKATLFLNGRAEAIGYEFTDGIIEVEVHANPKRSFAGISFRQQGNTMDEVYMRMHKGKQVDAVQYTPIFNGESNWQLYHQLQGSTAYKSSGWNQLKIEVKGQTARVWVNDKEVLFVDQLRSENEKGILGLFGLFGNRFAKFQFTPTEASPMQKVEKVETASGVIGEWKLSSAQIWKDDLQENINFSKLSGWQTAATEASGLLPISKYVSKTSKGNFEQNAEDYIVAQLNIESSKKAIKEFTFDYSDRIMVFLNGKLLFKGNNAFRSKGLQHTGHMSINANTLFLPLNKGDNLLQCVVIERGNGWGLMGQIKNRDGLRL